MHIDWWTLALQTINVLILVWLLARFLFRPVSDIIARRAEATRKLLADAEAARADVARARDEADSLRAETARQRDALLAEAHKAAEAEKTALAARASDELTRLRADAAAALARERAAAGEELVDRAAALSTDIAARLLARLLPSDTLTPFLDGLVAEIGALPPARRAAFLAPDDGGALTVVTAAPLDPEAEARVTAALTQSFGAPPPLAFTTDPSLIAGIELHGRHVALRNSWKDDLARIEEELNRDNQQAGSPRRLA